MAKPERCLGVTQTLEMMMDVVPDWADELPRSGFFGYSWGDASSGESHIEANSGYIIIMLVTTHSSTARLWYGSS